MEWLQSILVIVKTSIFLTQWALKGELIKTLKERGNPALFL
ncbi:hypothetical protein UF75_0532 [Desulfosporosinus sp. I2]|nr:hypothetical protein UF75_0532 [Desulfosporosinus sp. I2]